VLSSAVVNELVHKCDVVYHLAAAVGVRLIVEQPVDTLVTNVQGTETVLDYCNRFGKRVLVASTSEVYGDHREERPLGETARRIYGPTTARRWAYADSKAMDEFLALAYHQERGLDCVIARLFNTVGPARAAQYGMVIPRFVERALTGRRSRSTATARRRAASVTFRHDPGACGPHGRSELWGDLQRRLAGADRILRPAERVPHDDGLASGGRPHPLPPACTASASRTCSTGSPPSTASARRIGWRPEIELQRILEDVIVERSVATVAPG
jgi:GDP-D-mannose dehydratase